MVLDHRMCYEIQNIPQWEAQPATGVQKRTTVLYETSSGSTFTSRRTWKGGKTNHSVVQKQFWQLFEEIPKSEKKRRVLDGMATGKINTKCQVFEVAKRAIVLFKNTFCYFLNTFQEWKKRRVLDEMPTRRKGTQIDVFEVAKTAIVLFKKCSWPKLSKIQEWKKTESIGRNRHNNKRPDSGLFILL